MKLYFFNLFKMYILIEDAYILFEQHASILLHPLQALFQFVHLFKMHFCTLWNQRAHHNLLFLEHFHDCDLIETTAWFTSAVIPSVYPRDKMPVISDNTWPCCFPQVMISLVIPSLWYMFLWLVDNMLWWNGFALFFLFFLALNKKYKMDHYLSYRSLLSLLRNMASAIVPDSWWKIMTNSYDSSKNSTSIDTNMQTHTHRHTHAWKQLYTQTSKLTMQ